MRSSVFISAAIVAVASAQSDASSSSVDAYPQTSLLAQTNSLGVITGQFPVATSIPSQPTQPDVVTEQPAVVTSQPLPDNIPAVGTGIHTLVLPGTGSMFNSTRTVTVSANNSTTLVVAPATSAEASGSDATGSGATGSGASRTSGASGSPTGTGAPTQSEGAAAPNVKAAAGSLLGFGAIMAAFL